MRRREFLAVTTAAAAGMATSEITRAADLPSGRQFLELRTYHFASEGKRQSYEKFLSDAGVPALNRAAVEPVGVFKRAPGADPASKADDIGELYVLLPHNSMQSAITLEDRLAADSTFQQAGREILNAPKSDPAFRRYESTLLLAMEGFGRVRAPEKTPSRVFELRTYESPNVERARNKLQMFNNGEFSIFDRAGMPGVFFGGAIVGSRLPQLTYMIVHQDMNDMKKNWSAFFNDPDWKRLSGNPTYKDNVSKVIDVLLKPADGSQI